MADRRLRRMFPTRGGDQRHHPVVPALAEPEADLTGTGRIIDLAIYREGERIASPSSLPELYRLLGEGDDAMAWIGMYRPSTDQINSLAEEFDLHELAVEDSIVAHQRPKLERYGDVLFVVLSAARYLDDVEEVEFGELHVFLGPNFVITMRHSESPDLTGVRARLEGEDRDLLAMGPEAVLYAVLDRVVDAYLPVIAGLENDIDEMELQIFSGDPQVSSSEGPRTRCRTCWPGSRPGSTSTASTRSCSATCATWPTTTPWSPSGWTGSSRSCATCSR